MPETSRREVAESVFERNQRREAEINDALSQEAARRDYYEHAPPEGAALGAR